MTYKTILLLLIMLLPAGNVSGAEYRIAVFRTPLPEHGVRHSEPLATALQKAGLSVTLIDTAQLVDQQQIVPAHFDLLVLPSSDQLPARSIPIIEQYVVAGGDILALGTPAFTRPTWQVGARWSTRADWLRQLSRQRATHILVSFDRTNDPTLHRASSTPNSPVQRSLVDGPEGKALRIHIDDLQGWETLVGEPANKPFRPGDVLTCLWVKGSATTRRLSFEWRERDGSRWIAVFPVTKDWQRITLTPEDFHYWRSVPNRGRPGDRFHPENAVQFAIGLAHSHTGYQTGPQDYAIDQVGTAPLPAGSPPAVALRQPPRIDGLSPAYKFYTLHDVARIAPRAAWLRSVGVLAVPANMLAHHPRPTGKGIGKQRNWRWLPLVEAFGPNGQWRGAPLSMFVDFAGTNQGSIRTNVAIPMGPWYALPKHQQLLARIVQRMANGVFFQEAGSDCFTYRPGQQVNIGARIANLSRTDAMNLIVRFSLNPPLKATSPVLWQTSVDVAAGQTCVLRRAIQVPADGGPRTLRVELLQEGKVIDEVEHQIGWLTPRPLRDRRYVTARAGDFYLGTQKWYVHGVNYMPSTGIGTEDYAYFEYWLGARAYDPEFIQRDLERCRGLGLNSVSIFMDHRSLAAGNLLDILRRCARLGLKVNLSLRPGMPMHYDWTLWKQIIQQSGLADLDVIYAYDIAWEPFFGRLNERRRYDGLWRKWIERTYGSVAKAEQHWQVPATRFDHHVSSPTPAQLGHDGPQRKMVADYRRFVDELIDFFYQAAADRIRAIDPHHLISFRMTVTGDPTFNGADRMPYDFPGVSRSMDFMAPEGYGRVGDWRRVRPGIFTAAYARACAPGKPVLWAEAGTSVWDMLQHRATTKALEFQRQFYTNFYRMVLQSYSNGVVWWWYPGGFRVNERSDYGIINPDGTDRPVTRVIRKFAPQVLAVRDIPTPDTWIELDRDADARGLFGAYLRVKDKFWQAIDAGKTPGLRLQDAQSTQRKARRARQK